MKYKQFLILLLIAFSLTGCSIKHHVAKDYDRYLSNAAGKTPIPSTSLETDYYIDEATVTHEYSFRAASAGAANLWIVEFGEMLDDMLNSSDVQAAFGRLSKQTDPSAAGTNLILFDLVSYEFHSFAAHIDLKITLQKNSNIVFSEVYSAKGQPQGGKVFWGGGLAMKNAVHQSTEYALDNILTQFIEDVNKKG